MPNRGQFQHGNRRSVTHGLYTRRLPPELEEKLRGDLDQFMAAQLADEGEEPDRLPARRRSLLNIRTYVVQQTIAKLSHALLDPGGKGLLDAKGKLRVAWLQMLATYIDKAIRLDAMLGLDRKARRVESPIEWLERRSRETVDGSAAPTPAAADD